jgi:long-chain acyl-CoA synthetase
MSRGDGMVGHIVDHLLSAEAGAPRRLALEFEGRRTTYGELGRRARAIASGLAAHAIGPGSSVGLMVANAPQFVECLHGAWMNGNVVVPIEVTLLAKQLRRLVEDSEIRALVVLSRFVPQVEAAIATLNHAPRLFVIGGPGRHASYNRLLENGSSTAVRATGANAHVLTQYTWMGTGVLQGVQVTNANLVAQLEATTGLFPAIEGEKILCTLPLESPFALNGVLLRGIRDRSTVSLPARLRPAEVVHSLRHDGITTCTGVPVTYARVLAQKGAEPFPKLRRCIVGGAQMPDELLSQVEESFGAPVYQGYGVALAGGVVCANTPGARKAGSVGRPVRSVFVKIVDWNGIEQLAGSEGQILVAGPSVTRGYLNDPALTNEVIRNGWAHTRDIGYVDREGFVFVTDFMAPRRDGRDCGLRHVEGVLYGIPAVAEACVVGVPDPVRGARVRACVVFHPGREIGLDLVNRHLRANLPESMLPSEYAAMAKFPRGGMYPLRGRGYLGAVHPPASWQMWLPPGLAVRPAPAAV